MDPLSILPEPSYSAAILAAVGRLRGRRFIGGSLKGWRVLLLLSLLLMTSGLLSLLDPTSLGRDFFNEPLRGRL